MATIDTKGATESGAFGFRRIEVFTDGIGVDTKGGRRHVAAHYGAKGHVLVSREGGMAKLYISHNGISSKGDAMIRVDRAETLELIAALKELAGVA